MTRHRFINMFILICFLLTPMAVSAEEELLIGLIPEENIFRQIKKHKPLGEYLMQRLGILLARRRQFEEAIQVVKRAVELRPDARSYGETLRQLRKLAARPGSRAASMSTAASTPLAEPAPAAIFKPQFSRR